MKTIAWVEVKNEAPSIRVSPKVKFVSCLSADLLVFCFFCTQRFVSCSLLQTSVPNFPTLSAGFFCSHQVLGAEKTSHHTSHLCLCWPSPLDLELLPPQLPLQWQRCLSAVASATYDGLPLPSPLPQCHHHHDAAAATLSTPTPTPPPLPVNAATTCQCCRYMPRPPVPAVKSL